MTTEQTLTPETARQALWERSARAAGIGTYVLHLPGRALVVDDLLLEVSGLDRAGFTGRPEDVYAQLHPDDVDGVIAEVERALDTGGAYSAEYRILHPDGRTRWLAARGQTVTDQAGTVTALVGALYDVTALREATSRVAEVLESMAVGYVAMDPDWRITYLNAEGERIGGISREHLVGQDFWTAFPGTVGTVFETRYRRAVATGETATFDAYYPEPLDVWVEVRAVPEKGGLGLYFLDVTARRAAEDARDTALREQAADAQTMAGLVEVARDLGDADTGADVLAVVSGHAVALLGVRSCAVSLPQPDGGGVSVSTSSSDEVLATVDLLPADHPLPAVRTAVTGLPSFLPDLEAATAVSSGCEDACTAGGVAASAAVPLRARGHLLGSLSVAHRDPHPWSDVERRLLEALAALTAQALDRLAARDAERTASRAVARFSETLQRSLLTAPPEPDHLQIAVRYSPAAVDAQVGGDWYDAFLTADGTTSLVVGDVTGHDQHAAAAMGQLRNLLRGIGYAVGEPPARVLTVLDRAVHDLAVGAMATVVIAQVEQTPDQRAAGLRTLRWSNAGHLPPLLTTPDGTTRYLEAESDLLLGLDPDAARTDHDVVLQPGSTVLLFTDGLVERRGAHLQAGLDWLAAAVADLAHLPLDGLCDALLAQVGDRTEDDIALLALRAHPEDAPRPAGAGPGADPLAAPAPPSDHPARALRSRPPPTPPGRS